MLSVHVRDKTDFVRQHWFEAATEVAEVVSVLVDLHALAIVLDLRVHPVGAFLHGVLNGFTRLRLKPQQGNNRF